jgi:division protein CdvB (Snf7/Vps24/ESCRT-III family)
MGLRESMFETGGWDNPLERRDDMLQEYLKKMGPRLKELDAEIEKVKAKAETSGAELKEIYQDQVGRILTARKRVRSELAKLGEVGSERFEDVRKDVERAIVDLKKGVDEIVERIRKAA